MNQKTHYTILALLAAVALATLLSGQTTPRATEPTPLPNPTSISGTSMTPGMGALTPGYETMPRGSTTPGYGSNLYSIPPTTPQGMPTYSTTAPPQPAAGGTAGTTLRTETTAATGRPATASDCANGGWRNYDALKFKSQKGCEAWLKKHPARPATQGVGTPTMPTTPGRARALATPRVRRTPGAATPGYAETPGASITPFRDMTPRSR